MQSRGWGSQEGDLGGTVAPVKTVTGLRGVLGRLDNTEKGQGSMADLRKAGDCGGWSVGWTGCQIMEDPIDHIEDPETYLSIIRTIERL